MPKKSYNRILDEHLHILAAQGNHEAYERLKRSYHLHALSLCSNVLSQYPESGVSRKELVTVCDDYFPFIVLKFNPCLSSFYSFWKEGTTREIMDYMIENSYGADASIFKGSLSFDQEKDSAGNDYSDVLAESDYDINKQRTVFELKGLIMRNSASFSSQEKMLLILLLDGYSLNELIHTDIMSRANLYLTFNNAINKLQKFIKRWQKNNGHMSRITK